MYKNNHSIITLIEPKYRQQNLNNKQKQQLDIRQLNKYVYMYVCTYKCVVY